MRFVRLCFGKMGGFFWTAIKRNVGVHIHLIQTEIHVQKRKGVLIMRLLIFALCFLFF